MFLKLNNCLNHRLTGHGSVGYSMTHVTHPDCWPIWPMTHWPIVSTATVSVGFVCVTGLCVGPSLIRFITLAREIVYSLIRTSSCLWNQLPIVLSVNLVSVSPSLTCMFLLLPHLLTLSFTRGSKPKLTSFTNYCSQNRFSSGGLASELTPRNIWLDCFFWTSLLFYGRPMK